MKKLAIFLLAILVLPFAAADVYITEVMHSPTQMAHSDGEWIELYNSGTLAVNLSNYTIDGKDFEDTIIQPDEYIIIARELIDTDDADLDSFESYWGNNNGIWDETFTAVDGYFTLSTEDTIILTNGIYTEEINYSNLGANGRTIERISLTEWQESEVDGTPGYGNFTTQQPSAGEVEVHLTVSNSAPNITSISWLTDDSLEEGIQILPNVNTEKEVSLTLNYTDQDIQEIFLTINNNTYNYTNNNLTFSMQPYDLAQEYEINITICDNQYCDSTIETFEYLGIISTILDTSSLDFNLNANQEQETNIAVTNTGNVIVDVEIGGTDLVSNDYNISITNMQVFNNDWVALSTTPLIDLNLLPNTNEELLLKLTIPSEALPGDYNGIIMVTSMESI